MEGKLKIYELIEGGGGVEAGIGLALIVIAVAKLRKPAVD